MNTSKFNVYKFVFIFLLITTAAELTSRPTATVELRTATFIPSNALFQTLYGKFEPVLQLEATIDGLPYQSLRAWINFDQLHASGRLENGCGSSKITYSNVNTGIKYIVSNSNLFHFYLGIGPNVGEISLKNKSACASDEFIRRFGVGALAKIGFTLELNSHVFIDIFADYLYQWVDLQNCHNLGGFKTGLGMGFQIP